MAPFSLPKSIKIAPKMDLERHRFFDRFWHRFFLDFGSILEANLASKGSPWKRVLIAKFALGPFQTPPKTRLTARTRRDHQNGLQWRPPTPKKLPKWNAQRPKIRFQTSKKQSSNCLSQAWRNARSDSPPSSGWRAEQLDQSLPIPTSKLLRQSS